MRTPIHDLRTHHFSPLLRTTGVNTFRRFSLQIVYLSLRFDFIWDSFSFPRGSGGSFESPPDLFVSCRLTALFLLLQDNSCSSFYFVIAYSISSLVQVASESREIERGNLSIQFER